MTDRLKALADAGVSIWLDDLSRERIETGNLADLVEETARRRRDHQPDDLRRRRSPTASATTTRSASSRPPAPASTARRLRAHHRRRARRLRHPAPVFDATGGLRRPGLDRGRARAWPTTPTAPSRRPRDLWAAVDRPNAADQDPGDRARACRPSPPPSAEGISVNVTLIFGLDRYRDVMDAYLAGLEQAATRARPVDHPLGGVVLRLPGRHRGRQAPRGHRHRRGRGAAGQGRGRQRPAGLRRLRRGLRRRRAGSARGRRRQRAAAAVGLDRRQGPGLPRHALRRRAGRGRTPSTRCPRRRCEAFADHGEVTGDTVTGLRRRGPRRSSPTLAEVGVDFDDVLAVLEDEGVDKFVDVLGRAGRPRSTAQLEAVAS